MFSDELLRLAELVVRSFEREGKKIALAEASTGGFIAAALTEIRGASACFDRGLVCYSDASKEELLGVSPQMLERHGLVSGIIAEDMAQGALQLTPVDVALSATGVIEPGKGNTETPLGLFYFGLAQRDGSCFHYRCSFLGDQGSLREQAAKEAMRLLLSSVEKGPV